MTNRDGRTDFGFIAQEIENLLGTQYDILGIGGDAFPALYRFHSSYGKGNSRTANDYRDAEG